jgi:hypothetical protein
LPKSKVWFVAALSLFLTESQGIREFIVGTGYDFSFIPAAGSSFQDSGSGSC